MYQSSEDFSPAFDLVRGLGYTYACIERKRELTRSIAGGDRFKDGGPQPTRGVPENRWAGQRALA